jgi:hypothetical protein
VGDDLVCDPDLATHGVEGDERTFELSSLGEFVVKLRNGRNIVGFFRHAELRQYQSCIGGVSTERMERLERLASVVGAA